MSTGPGAGARPGGDGVARVRAALAAHGMADRIAFFDQSTRTSADAAAAIGCTVAQIAKSLVFRSPADAPVLVIASGANRVDEKLAAVALGHALARADAEFVRARTGFVIGGVSPVGLAAPLRPLIDRDLLTHAEIWAAAGAPNAVFRLTPDELLRLTGGLVSAIHPG